MPFRQGCHVLWRCPTKRSENIHTIDIPFLQVLTLLKDSNPPTVASRLTVRIILSSLFSARFEERLAGFLAKAVARQKNTLLSIRVQIWSFVRTDPFLSVTNFTSHQSASWMLTYTCFIMNVPFATWDRLAAVLIGPDTNSHFVRICGRLHRRC